MSTPEEREVIMDFIEAYRDMTFLWNRKHKDYRNKSKRLYGHKVLLKIYKKLDKKATVQAVIKKVENIRTYYFKELSKVKKSLESGEKPYVPTIYYFDAMNFLQPGYEAPNSGCESFEAKCEYLTESDGELETKVKIENRPASPSSPPASPTSPPASPTSPPASPTSPPQSPPSSPSPPRKKRKTKFADSNKRYSENGRSQENQFDLIGRGIGLQLKGLEKKQFFIAQKLIHETIFYAQMGLLTTHSTLTGLLVEELDEDLIEQ